VPLVFGEIAEYAPQTNDGITFGFSVPETTASSGTGAIFFQIRSSSNLQWVALGEGTQMAGANIFVVYASSDGNVTLSPRLGIGEFEPEPNSAAQVSLLEGSGIRNGVMIANVQCDSCISWSSGNENVTSTSSPWIWAVRHGQPLNSNSVSEDISMHDIRGTFSVNLAQATGGNADNPFLNEGNSSSIIAINPQDESMSAFKMKRKAHATIMSVTFVILFPSFALTIRVVRSSKTVPLIHAPLQLFTLAAAVAGLGLGISMAKETESYSEYHPIIGIIVVSSLVLFQPLMGFLQHMHYRDTGKKSLFAYTHRWLGRILITLGIINGGLGFRFTQSEEQDVSIKGVIAYGVVAGVMACVYIIFLFLSSHTRGRKRDDSRNENGPLEGISGNEEMSRGI
jgi:hypothetical protein